MLVPSLWLLHSAVLEVVSFKVAALRRPFEARDDTTLRMKIVSWIRHGGIQEEPQACVVFMSSLSLAEVRDEPNKLPQDTPADVAEAVKGLLHKAQRQPENPAHARICLKPGILKSKPQALNHQKP